MHPRFLNARALIAAAATAVFLAACSGGGSNPMPSTAGLSPANHVAAQSPTLAAQDERRGGGDDDGGGSGSGGGAMTFTLVNGLQTDSSFNFNNARKACDATLADAPTYSSSSFLGLVLPKVVSFNDCNSANLNLTLGTTNDYIVLVDETQGNTITAIAGPASETLGVYTFAPSSTPLVLATKDQYAFFVATGTGSTGGSGGCGDEGKDRDHHHHDGGDDNDHHGNGDGDHHGGGDCHGDGDHHGDHDH